MEDIKRSILCSLKELCIYESKEYRKIKMGKLFMNTAGILRKCLVLHR